MERENQENKETKRLTIWAVIFILMGIVTVILLDIDQARELLELFAHIITNLIIGS